MISRIYVINASSSVASAIGLGICPSWSRPISSRADAKLAPCMTRPNLFSGD